ncbi:methyltransferase [Rhodobacterales bacterium HKCCE2091]|nr:methyltransferase [Rhodobacterales bacterium HKCCE2091]
MTPDRWTLALDQGAITRPDGRVLALNARAEADLSALGDVHAVTGFYPDHRRLAARGFATGTEPEGPYGAALVQIVKSKPATLAAIAEALAHLEPGGLLMIDGQKAEGIESVLKTLRAELPVDDVMSKSHGKLAWLTRPDAIPDTVAGWLPEAGETEQGYVTLPGMFSSEGPDEGSELLVALVPQLKGRVADLGAGWGYIAGEILAEQDGIETFDLIEADHASIRAAEANIADDRARFHWADATAFDPEAPYDAIMSNPPFHTGHAADPGLGRAFIAAAARMLKPSGRFFMVANRHLPYEAALKAAFGTGRMLADLNGYKLYEAAKPKRARA